MSLITGIDLQQPPGLLHDMEKQGYAVLEQVITEEGLRSLRHWVDGISDRANHQYTAVFGDTAKIDDTPLAALLHSMDFEQLMRSLASVALKREVDESLLPVLRCVQGASGKKKSNAFHYDASAITALVPIDIPEQGSKRGDLLLFANIRPFRSLVVINVLEKIILQNRLARQITQFAIRRNWLKPMRLRLKPGNIYLFYGYRSLHANDECDPALRRATVLIHLGNPHRGSRITRAIIRVNRFLAGAS